MPSKPYQANLYETRTVRARNSSTAMVMNRNFVQFVWTDHAGTPNHNPHSHAYDQLHIMTEGRMEMTIEGEQYLLEPGHALYVPANATHTGYAVDAEGASWIEMFGDIRWERLVLAQHHLDWEREQRAIE